MALKLDPQNGNVLENLQISKEPHGNCPVEDSKANENEKIFSNVLQFKEF